MRKVLTKQSVVFALFVLIGFCMKAESKWNLNMNLDPIITNFDHYDNLQFSVGVNRAVYEDVSVGLAVGVYEDWKFKGNPYVPILANAHAEFLNTIVRPMVDFRVGYAFSTKGNKDAGNGVVVNPMVGGRFRDLGLSLGYYGVFGTSRGGSASCMAVRLTYFINL